MRRKVGPLGIVMALGRGVWSARKQWQSIPLEQRTRLQELARRSGGRPSSLSPAERQEFGALLRDVDVAGLARQAAMDATFSRRGYRRF